MCLTKNLIKRNKEGKRHDIHLLLNGFFEETIEKITEELSGLKDDFTIEVWNEGNDKVTFSREMYEEAVERLSPDMVVVTSLFEPELSIPVVKRGSFKTAVILYDLIPLIFREKYQFKDSSQWYLPEEWYKGQLDQLKKADVLLSISEASRRDYLKLIENEEGKVVTISSAIDNEKFGGVKEEATIVKEKLVRLGIVDPFIFYVGGNNWRKNVEGLLETYSCLPDYLKSKYQLVITYDVWEAEKKRLMKLSEKLAIKDRVVFTGFLPDECLELLYSSCTVFIFPSFYEGFGLPVLEAMSCGAPVIVSNTSSLPEIVEYEEALFDPYNESSIKNKLTAVLQNEELRKRLMDQGKRQSRKFSWSRTASQCLESLEKLVLS